jgi:hypothetical protein
MPSFDRSARLVVLFVLATVLRLALPEAPWRVAACIGHLWFALSVARHYAMNRLVAVYMLLSILGMF